MDNAHFAVFGRSGFGKTNYLELKIIDDIEKRDRAVFYIDPHGHSAHTILDAIPSPLTEHVCFLDFSDYHYSVSFNPNTDPHLTTDALRTRWKESWGERLEYIAYHALAAVFEAKRPISDIPALFYSDLHRKKIIGKITNHETRRFWLHEFPSWSNRLQEEAPIALLNKIGQLNSSKAARSINQVHPTFDLVTAIQKKQIVVVNLAKGYLGDQTALTLGSLFTSIFAQAVYQVQKPVSFYADEFQNYGSHIYTTMLSEYRKFGLKLGLCCQFASQLDETLLDAILSNARDLVVFNISNKDAELLAPQFNSDTQDFNSRVLTTLPKYTAVINGHETPIPPFNPTTANRLHVVRKASRRRFGRPTI